MLVLVELDLTQANLELFDEYEARVLARLEAHGATLEARVRSLDQASEIHLVQFPSKEAREAFRDDPVRVAAQDLWARCGASATNREVTRIN